MIMSSVLNILSIYVTLFFCIQYYYFHFFEENFSSNPSDQVLKLANLLNHSKLKYIGSQV